MPDNQSPEFPDPFKKFSSHEISRMFMDVNLGDYEAQVADELDVELQLSQSTPRKELARHYEKGEFPKLPEDRILYRTGIRAKNEVVDSSRKIAIYTNMLSETKIGGIVFGRQRSTGRKLRKYFAIGAIFAGLTSAVIVQNEEPADTLTAEVCDLNFRSSDENKPESLEVATPFYVDPEFENRVIQASSVNELYQIIDNTNMFTTATFRQREYDLRSMTPGGRNFGSELWLIQSKDMSVAKQAAINILQQLSQLPSRLVYDNIMSISFVTHLEDDFGQEVAWKLDRGVLRLNPYQVEAGSEASVALKAIWQSVVESNCADKSQQTDLLKLDDAFAAILTNPNTFSREIVSDEDDLFAVSKIARGHDQNEVYKQFDQKNPVVLFGQLFESRTGISSEKAQKVAEILNKYNPKILKSILASAYQNHQTNTLAKDGLISEWNRQAESLRAQHYIGFAADYNGINFNYISSGTVNEKSEFDQLPSVIVNIEGMVISVSIDDQASRLVIANIPTPEQSLNTSEMIVGEDLQRTSAKFAFEKILGNPVMLDKIERYTDNLGRSLLTLNVPSDSVIFSYLKMPLPEN